MSLSNSEINLILSKLPKFELSYENIIHKKIHNANVILAIPEGIKCFAWFTTYNNENVCFILELTEKNTVVNIKKSNTSFVDCLALGTIFYGTLFKYNNVECFCIEDIYYYKGKNHIHTSYFNKLEILKHIFTNELTQNVLNNNFIIFGLPLFHTNFNTLLNEIQSLPYKISSLKYRFFEKHNTRKIMSMAYFKPNEIQHKNYTPKRAIFKLMAGIAPDIYNLFIFKCGKEEFFDIAHIPDYNTSVMMNKLFRNIRENHNLDFIEESDNEEDFEDIREDKYVYLDRSLNVSCVYNCKFKRWVPICLASETDTIISYEQLLNII